MVKHFVDRGGKVLLTLTMCCLCFQPIVSAATVQVPSMGIKTIAEAMMRSRVGDTVWVESGIYRENILVAPGVTLMARSTFQSIIDGGGRGTVVTMGKNTTISGFEIRNGTIGVFSNGSGNQIISCRIIRNWQTGIIVVRHLPKIEDNIIAFNRASGIQGWDVRSTNATINHNSIAYNANHGIAVGGSSEIIMENNVIAFNERFGLKILADAERIQVSNNNFYGNLRSPRPIPDGNFSFNPAFTAPRTSMDFKSDPAQCCSAKGTDNEDLGTRTSY
jgi:nitrous oxidase accessory protein NosD